MDEPGDRPRQGARAMTDLVRICPNCGSERPATEVSCQGEYQGRTCNWSLFDVPLATPGVPEPAREPLPPEGAAGSERLCVNGHPVSEGDLLCLICGADLASEVPEPPPLSETVIDGWRLVESLDTHSSIHERFVVEAEDGKRRALLTLYRARSEPDSSILQTLRRQPLAHVPEILGSGRWNDRAYDVMEFITGGSLQDLGCQDGDSLETLHRIVDEIGKALASFAEIGLRHRDIRPGTILVRRAEPLDLVITGFGSARLSDFDLDIVSPLELTRYSAPETIVGGVSAASDWWSLGMILLERITYATCFAGVNEQAFMIHVVTRGVSVPADLDPLIRQLLRGLLTRDPGKRWQWPQVRRWLSGEDVEVAPDPFVESHGGTGPTIALGGQSYTKPANYALAAAEAQRWDAAKDMFMRGIVSTWLMQNPAEGYELVTGPVCEQLRRMERELWLYQLRERAERVRERARILEIELDEETFQVVVLATSRANLEAEWAARRRLFPDTDHAGLASLIDRHRIADDDLVLLRSVALTQFEAIDPIMTKAEEVARHVGIDTFDHQAARNYLATSRRDIYHDIDQRIAGFARCGNPTIDEWADTFRVERWLPLPRALVLLALPEATWTELPRQQYVEQILQFFEKRAANIAQRGPLVRLLIGKTTPRVDVTEIGSAQLAADSLLQRLIERTGLAANISLEVLQANPTCEVRLRRLVSHASTYRRDTGIDGLYLGFPFLVFQDHRAGLSSRVPRIAPILLWPIRIEIETGIQAPVKVSFDKDREEVRLNPAFDGLLGLAEAVRWREALRDLLEQPAGNPRRVVEAFAHLAMPREFSLSSLPNKDFRVAGGTREIVYAAVFFHAEFAGQGISEDLRQLQ